MRSAMPPSLRKRYVVKGTNEPGRTLFAEYC